jgi:hypothetical protein
MNAFLAECTAVAADLADSQHPDARELGVGLAAATRALAAASTRLIALVASDARAAAAGAATFLRATGLVGGGLALALGCRVVLARQHENADGIAFSRAKLAGARFYAEHWLATVPALAHTAASGSAGTLALADDAI